VAERWLIIQRIIITIWPRWQYRSILINEWRKTMKNNRCGPHVGRGDPQQQSGSRGDPPVICDVRGDPPWMLTSRGDPPLLKQKRDDPPEVRNILNDLFRIELIFRVIGDQNWPRGRGMPGLEWWFISYKWWVSLIEYYVLPSALAFDWGHNQVWLAGIEKINKYEWNRGDENQSSIMNRQL